MSSLNLLPNELLQESYQEAIQLNLDTDFIKILEQEIKKRGISND